MRKLALFVTFSCLAPGGLIYDKFTILDLAVRKKDKCALKQALNGLWTPKDLNHSLVEAVNLEEHFLAEEFSTILLEAGASLNFIDDRGLNYFGRKNNKSLVALAIERKNFSLLCMLLRRGANSRLNKLDLKIFTSKLKIDECILSEEEDSSSAFGEVSAATDGDGTSTLSERSDFDLERD